MRLVPQAAAPERSIRREHMFRTRRPRTGRLLMVAVLAGGAVALSASRLAARDAMVTLKDGRTMTGEFVREDETRVVLRISNVETPFTRDQIRSFEYVASVEEQYQS